MLVIMDILFVLAFLSGVLTLFAPCVFTIIPVILGGTLRSKGRFSPFVIVLSFLISIFIFTLVLKATTLLIDINLQTWAAISGGIILLIGIFTLFPNLWSEISVKSGFETWSQKFLNWGKDKDGYMSDALVGMSLGPVFSSCSPTYSLILATIFPVSFFQGIYYLLVYLLGLSLVLLLIVIFGHKFTSRYRWMTNPSGAFKKIIGLVLIVVGIMVIFRLDKRLETYFIKEGIYNPTRIEQDLIQKVFESR